MMEAVTGIVVCGADGGDACTVELLFLSGHSSFKTETRMLLERRVAYAQHGTAKDHTCTQHIASIGIKPPYEPLNPAM